MAVVIVLVVVVLLVLVAFAVRRGAAAANARIEATVGDLDVLRRAKANLQGQASSGERQVRGLGTLVLTPDELVFLQMVPAGEVRVPRVAVTDVEVARSFLDKEHARDLLVVTWGEDQVAFDVPDVEEWRVALTDG